MNLAHCAIVYMRLEWNKSKWRHFIILRSFSRVKSLVKISSYRKLITQTGIAYISYTTIFRYKPCKFYSFFEHDPISMTTSLCPCWCRSFVFRNIKTSSRAGIHYVYNKLLDFDVRTKTSAVVERSVISRRRAWSSGMGVPKQFFFFSMSC